MISKEKIDKLLGFTLAEILITMIVIALLALASIPVIKKSKEYRELSQDQHTWYATYDSSNNLVVYEDGTAKTGSDYIGTENGETFAKFTPPDGVSKFNVTVIGGGGGGAAGETGVGAARVYFPDTEDRSFTPVKAQEYQIVAVGGGGGGGGGGAAAGSARGGYSGGVVIARATLEKNKTYNVFTGPGGGGGHTDSVLGIIGGFLGGLLSMNIKSMFNVTGDLFGLGDWMSDMIFKAQPSSKWDGGGHGVSSIVWGHGLRVEAGGGCGGAFRYWGTECAWFVCYPKKKWSGGCDGGYANQCTGATCITNWAPQKINPTDPQHGGIICRSADNCYPENLAGNLEGDITGYGNGGKRGGSGREGKPGSDGYVQIKETPLYGGGGGQAGNVSFYTFERSPIEKNSDENFVKVYIGKGGLGATESGKKGEDGQFSRFGTRIIADGGRGGEPRANNMETASANYQVPGQDGAKTAVPANIIEKLGLTVNMLLGGYNNGNANIDGQGFAQNGIQATPGSGGAGGGGKGDENYNVNNTDFGTGGNGAPGLVVVTW